MAGVGSPMHPYEELVGTSSPPHPPAAALCRTTIGSTTLMAARSTDLLPHHTEGPAVELGANVAAPKGFRSASVDLLQVQPVGEALPCASVSEPTVALHPAMETPKTLDTMKNPHSPLKQSYFLKKSPLPRRLVQQPFPRSLQPCRRAASSTKHSLPRICSWH